MEKSEQFPPVLGIAWGPATFLAASHLIGISAGILYGIFHGFTVQAVLIAVLFIFLTNFAVGGGYHRCFAHGSYQAHWLLRLFFVCLGSASFEGHSLNWAAMHRRHHMVADTADDPHNIKRGFFWAHMGWIIMKVPESRVKANIDDLLKDRVLQFERRFYVPLAVTFGILLPWGLGWLFGDPWGGLAIGGFLRIVIFHHITWFINSMAHTVGHRPYSQKVTARDSFVTALLTMGEGYHNYHHSFPWDYRNGYGKLTWDPTKWLIWSAGYVGLARNLQRVDKEVIARHESIYR